MRTIVAIGGGEIGRPGHPVETLQIDRRLFDLTGKTRPRLLFLPTASDDSELYCQTVDRHFGKRLGFKVDHLLLTKASTRPGEIAEKVEAADIIYVGGGNTLKMMMLWRKRGLDALLERAWDKGTILSGLSAGAICWFNFGSSDCRQKSAADETLIRVRGLGLIDALCSPHFDDERAALKRLMLRVPGVALALDDCAAAIVGDRSIEIITSRRSAGAYRCQWQGSRYLVEPLPKNRALDLTAWVPR